MSKFKSILSTYRSISICFVLLFSTVLLACSGSSKKEDPKVNVTGLTLSLSEMNLIVNEPKKLTATVSPTNATNKKVIWESNNTTVATVNSVPSNTFEVTVIAKSVGQANIIAKTEDGNYSQNCTVNIRALDIYLAGSFGIWKNGEILPGYDDAKYESGRIADIVVSDNGDIHAVGDKLDLSHQIDYENGGYTSYWGDALYYKNGVPTVLPRAPRTKFAQATRLAVANNGDVYIIGVENYGFFGAVHCPEYLLWKNGVRQQVGLLPDKPTATLPSFDAISIQDDDVYIFGCLSEVFEAPPGEPENNWTYGKSFPVLWKNGIPQFLGDLSVIGSTGSMFVTPNKDVYLATTRGLLKNGVFQSGYPSSEAIQDIFVTEQNDVYICGFPNNDIKAIYRKNGVRYDLPCTELNTFTIGSGKYATATRIKVSKAGDVYIAGRFTIRDRPDLSHNGYYESAKFWINGVEQSLNLPERNMGDYGDGTRIQRLLIK